jgi:hypothetical protein
VVNKLDGEQRLTAIHEEGNEVAAEESIGGLSA